MADFTRAASVVVQNIAMQNIQASFAWDERQQLRRLPAVKSRDDVSSRCKLYPAGTTYGVSPAVNQLPVF